MNNPIITVKNVSLSYRIVNTRSLKKHGLRGSFKKIENFYALKDVSFEIEKGRRVGIIGPNGAGKSTLLRTLAGIYKPDSGLIEYGTESISLLSLGAGFENDLSGIDNIYLNGSLLGISRKQIDKIIDEIIEFASIGEFIEKPVRTYSSGMRSRLAFSITSSVNPDVLLIDEVLSVGDEDFKEKSKNRIIEMMDSDRTVIIVSHSMTQISELCDQIIFLDKGKIIDIGDPVQIIDRYINKYRKKK